MNKSSSPSPAPCAPATAPNPPTITGSGNGSLWQDAKQRFSQNRPAMISFYTLLILALLGVFGPMISPHPYDKIYPKFVHMPPSLNPYPNINNIGPDLQQILTQAHLVTLQQAPVLNGNLVTISVRNMNGKPLDPRILRYFNRSDLFTDAQLHVEPDGGSGTVSLEITQNYFLFGTDNVGRDLLSRILVGIRFSLAIGLLASFISLILGVCYGAIAGYIGGRADNIMMRIVDILYSLPFIFFVILILVFLGRSVFVIFLAIAATEWLDMARIIRGQTLSLKRQEFVQAAQALGSTQIGIITRHIIPNTIGPVIIFLTLLVPKAILLESTLSFLGLGVQDPMTSLGVLIAEGTQNMQDATWLLIWPAMTLTIILFALSFLGDGLRDSLDPKEH